MESFHGCKLRRFAKNGNGNLAAGRVFEPARAHKKSFSRCRNQLAFPGMAGSQFSSDKNRLEPIWDSCRRHPRWTLTLLTLVSLAPFLTKAFNMDDPLFIWAAQQIQAHPGHPYAFDVNWFGFSQLMWAATQNPPLMSYYLALAAQVLGWSEAGLHFACLLPAVAVVLGTYRLARNFCRWPLVAALATLFAPGFFLSCTTVMCDVLMLAFWIWAVVFWVEGLEKNNAWKLTAAGILTALAVLAKYNGVCLLPLLAAYGWIEKRAAGRWALFLLIPVAAVGAHEWWTFQLYGQPHLFASDQYAKTAQISHGVSKLVCAINALTFAGGGCAAALFCAPFLWRKRVLLSFTAGTALLVTLALAGGIMAKNLAEITGRQRFCVESQIVFWAVGGACVLALAVTEVWQKRDARSWLLAFWVAGTFGFAAFVYWMVNGRVILPMVPAVAILIARRLEQNRLALPANIKFSFVACAALSLLAALADFQLAGTARKSAEQVCAKYAASPGRVWFEGHWGFQYYMQSCGAWPIDFKQPVVAVGDILIIPVGNSNTRPPSQNEAAVLEVFSLPVFPWFSTGNQAVGAGFYSSFFGPLPFAFGPVPPEKLVSYVLKNSAANPHQ
jgi:4-amino-4-deoxy-L-arabinose transferase-like glycosyltransferase